MLNFTEVLPVHHGPTRHPVPLPLFSSGMKSLKKPTAEKLRAWQFRLSTILSTGAIAHREPVASLTK
jgi:hypothetical protein